MFLEPSALTDLVDEKVFFFWLKNKKKIEIKEK